MQSLTFRSLEDFTQVAAADLPRCMHAFSQLILQTRDRRADVLKINPQGAPKRLEEFVWRSRDAVLIDKQKLSRTTPIEELGLKPTALHHLRDMRVFCLEDCAEVFARELQVRPDIGNKTIAILREQLLAIELDFKEDPDPERALLNRSRSYRRQPLADRAEAISDEDHVYVLGLKDATLSKAVDNGLTTVGLLRSYDLENHRIIFGKQQYLEIEAALKCIQRYFLNPPTARVLWRYGLKKINELTLPSDPNTPLKELQPWLGVTIRVLSSQGITTLGDLRTAFQNSGTQFGKGVVKRVSVVLKG